MSLLNDLINLDLSDSTEKIIAEYIWIGGSGMDLRSKARTLPGPVSDPHKLPKWNYDGSSTGQAPGEDSEVILYPQAIFKDPFRRGNNILVMCDAYTPAGEPIPTNKRYNAAKIFSHPHVVAEVPWYGIEQEYTLLQKDVKWPIGWPVGGYPGPQGPYYCSAGADKAFGHDIVDAHYKACLYAGINISGINGEVMPGQWEFQVGPSVGISAGDELWVARYILERITEIAGVVLSFDPKPIQGDWNGAGAHTNYSPQAIFKDPFRRGNNILVMCDAYTPAGEPIPTNKRYNAAKIFSHPHVVAEVPRYGIEQEYTLLQKDVKWPIGWPLGGYPRPQLITAYYYQYNQEKVSSYHAHGQYQNEVQLRDMGATAASNGSTNSDSLNQILARLSSMLEFDPSKPDYHLWNQDTVQPTVNNGNQDHGQGSVSRPTSPASSEKNLGPIVPPAGGQQKDSCPVVCDDFHCGGHLFKAIYSFFVGKVKAHVD